LEQNNDFANTLCFNTAAESISRTLRLAPIRNTNRAHFAAAFTKDIKHNLEKRDPSNIEKHTALLQQFQEALPKDITKEVPLRFTCYKGTLTITKDNGEVLGTIKDDCMICNEMIAMFIGEKPKLPQMKADIASHFKDMHK